jgi:hypothetical protein
MVGINRKAFGLFVPPLTDVLIRRESSKCFESFGKVVRHQESLEMFLEMLMSLLMVFLYGRFL